jgi:hypothetical protein
MCDTSSATASREEIAERINESMTRFGLIVSVLEELSRSTMPATGDVELRNGCERALTRILSVVAVMTPATSGGHSIGPEERKAMAWLAGKQLVTLIDPDKLAVLASLIDQLLPPVPVSRTA